MRRAALAVVAGISLGLSLMPACGGDEGTGDAGSKADVGPKLDAGSDAATWNIGDASDQIIGPDASSGEDAATAESDASTLPPDGSTPSGDGGMSGPVSFANDVQPIFNKFCISCHKAGGSGPMSLEAGASYGNLVGKTATGASCKSGGYTLVVAGNTSKSLLWNKLKGSQPCGAFMPKNATKPLGSSNPTEFGVITNWITQGALNN